MFENLVIVWGFLLAGIGLAALSVQLSKLKDRVENLEKWKMGKEVDDLNRGPREVPTIRSMWDEE